ncbi:MAG TPA: ATP-binding protein [Thermomonospora sp.]|nr:ATP-binding protein [Thermomonospora sp.]
MTTDEYRLSISMLASPSTPGLARTLTRARLHHWGDAHLVADAHVVVSELVTNAINETPGKEILFRLTRDATFVVVAVWDSSPRLPQARPAAPPGSETLDLSPARWDDNGGWGLPIVAALSVDCGYKPDPRGGKWVWARLKP